MFQNYGRIVGIVLIALVALSLIYSAVSSNRASEEKPLSTVIADTESNRVNKITVKGDTLNVLLKDGSEYTARKEAATSVFDLGIDPAKVQVVVKGEGEGALWINLFSSLLPFLLIFGFLWFIFRQAQGASSQALSFGRSRARLIVGETRRRLTFRDVAGSEEAKQELWEVVEFLKYPSKFLNLGARIPKGVLLVGPPGTGKTLLAKAVAGEAGVPFFSISGSEFVEMFVGVGAARVRDLFQRAKRNAPCIVFIDEIDAVGRHRGAGLGGSHDEREQTLNQILVEMDGFETDTNVIVMAATNRPDILDPALLRPGRFDRRVVLARPDIRERELILNLHTQGKPLEEGVDLHRIAAQTPGFSGADLQNLVNEAAILAARANQQKIGLKDLEGAVEKVLLGPERKVSVLSDEEKKITAYHEAGHAIVTHTLPLGDPVQKVSIISRGMALGYTWSHPLKDRYLHSREKLLSDIAVMLGGWVAERMIFKDITTGAANDLREATRLARKMVMEFGMSEKLGPIVFGEKEELVFLGKELHERPNYSEKSAAAIDEEVKEIIEEAKKIAEAALKEHKNELQAVAAQLIQKETLSKEEFESFFGS